MTAVVALLLAITGIGLDLPPEIVAPAVASAPAERLDPPTTEVAAPDSPSAGTSASAGGRCIGWEPLLTRESPGWSVERMSRIMYRESRCLPSAKNPRSSASGLLQLLSSLHCGWLARELGPCDLFNPTYNIRAAALLWRKSGYGAWSTS